MQHFYSLYMNEHPQIFPVTLNVFGVPKNGMILVGLFGGSRFTYMTPVYEVSNADIILNSIGWLSRLENLISIEKEDIEVPRLDLTSKQKRTIIVILCALPIFIAFLGCFVWWKTGATQ